MNLLLSNHTLRVHHGRKSTLNPWQRGTCCISYMHQNQTGEIISRKVVLIQKSHKQYSIKGCFEKACVVIRLYTRPSGLSCIINVSSVYFSWLSSHRNYICVVLKWSLFLTFLYIISRTCVHWKQEDASITAVAAVTFMKISTPLWVSLC